MLTKPVGTASKFFDGWVVVAAVFTLFVVNAGIGFYGLSVFLEAITDERGFSTAEVSLATSIFFVVAALAGRLIAPVIGRRDIRWIIAIGAVISAVGIVMIGQSTTLPLLYVSYIVFAIGNGFTGLVPGTTLVTRWFHAKRSVALSVASTGLSVGGLTIAVAASKIIDRLGMEGAAPWLALIYVGGVGVAMLGLWPDPIKRDTTPDGLAPVDGEPIEATGTPYEEAVRSPFFRLLTLAFVFTMGAQVGGIAQLFKFGTERAEVGALLVSTLAFTSILARLAGGVVALRVPLVVMTSALTALQAVALFWLSQSFSRSALVIGTIIFGVTIGNLLMLMPLVSADQFGVRDYPRIFSRLQLIVTGFGVAGGPYLLGWLRDGWSYTTSYAVAAGLSVCGAILFALASKLTIT